MSSTHFEVMTYAVPSALVSGLQRAGLLHNAVHVVATQSLAAGFRYPLLSPPDANSRPRSLLPCTVPVTRWLREVAPEWWSGATRVHMMTHIREITRRRCDVLHPPLVALAARRDTDGVYDTIRRAVEAGIQPHDGAANDATAEGHLIAIWEELERRVEQPRALRRLFWEHPPERLHAAAARALTVDSARPQDQRTLFARKARTTYHPVGERIGTVVAHGFSVISPLQLQLFRRLAASGCRVVFIACYDPKRAHAFAVWKRSLAPAWGFPPIQAWRPLDAGDTASHPMHAAIGSAPPPATITDLEAVVYADVLALREDFPDHAYDGHGRRSRQGETCHLYSPDSAHTEDALIDLLPPNRNRERILFAWPVGQLLRILHSAWREQQASHALVLTADDMEACLMAATVGDPTQRSRLLGSFRRLRPFLDGSQTRDQWNRGLRQLSEVHAATRRAFDPATLPSWEHALANPFRSWSPYGVLPKDVRSVTEAIQWLWNTTEALFGSHPEHDKRSVGAHASLLSERILEPLLAQGAFSKPERHIINLLQTRLRQIESGDLARAEFHPADLAESVLALLGGELDDADDNEPSDLPVQPLYGLDEVPFRFALGDRVDDLVHVCTASLLAQQAWAVWGTWMDPKQSFDERVRHGHEGVRLLIEREACEPLLRRYLLYIGSRWAPKFRISWCERWMGEEGVGPIAFAARLKRIGVVPRREEGRNITWSSRGRSPKSVVNAYVPGPHTPPDVLGMWHLCPRRAWFDYGLAEGPQYRSEFHLEWLYGRWSKLLRSGASTTTANQILQEAVPGRTAWWRDQAVLAPNCSSGQTRWNGGRWHHYRAHLAVLGSPRQDSLAAARSVMQQGPSHIEYARLSTEFSTAAGQLASRPDATPGHHCRFCPHLLTCDAGEYPIDDSLRGGSE